eukprot:TRINITY_DN29385_c0_g1_i1.p1 TRINITY_DN29385_c0_g1~~TRINITY_DN29385_c0_g1_i1.p1  ORF type:complete len:222 (-),score=57.88 TRINITY_DN29385_c0_g1_i1:20-685(-)
MPLFKPKEKKDTTVFPSKKSHKGTATYDLYKSLKASLGSGLDIKEAVKVPKGESRDDWIAMNVKEIFNTAVMCFHMLSASCTDKSCPEMNAGSKAKFLWPGKDKEAPIQLSAPEYIFRLIEWVDETTNDEKIFPAQGSTYPKTFLPSCKKLIRRIMHVYAHIFNVHWQDVMKLEAEAHVNICFKHLYYFGAEFGFFETDDLRPVATLIEKLEKRSEEEKKK